MGAGIVTAAHGGAGLSGGGRGGKRQRRTRRAPRSATLLLWALMVGLAVLAGSMAPPDTARPAAAASSYPVGSLDSPAEGATVISSVDVSGWAADLGASVGVGVDRVQVYFDSALRGTATYGLS